MDEWFETDGLRGPSCRARAANSTCRLNRDTLAQFVVVVAYEAYIQIAQELNTTSASDLMSSGVNKCVGITVHKVLHKSSSTSG